MSLLMILVTLVAVVIVGYYILKSYHPVFVFFFSGIILLIAAFYFTGTPIPSGAKRAPETMTFWTTLLDSFVFITDTFKKQLAGVGLIIMAVAGFAGYMKYINASAKLAYLSNKPLGKIQNKYLILSGTFVVGMALKIVISSYAGLMLLLLACIYPVLVSLKIRPITAVAVLSLIGIDYGPKDGNTVQLAGIVGQQDNVVGIFLDYQIYPVLVYVVLLAILIPFYFSYIDKKDAKNGVVDEAVEIGEIIDPKCPTYYIFFPWLPVVFLFAAYFLNFKLDVVTVIFVSIAIVFIIEFIRHRSAKVLCDGMVVILKSMADIFISVVSIIVAAGVFAEGIKALGGIGTLAEIVSGMGASAVILTIAILSFIVYFATVIMGSGIAAFQAFGKIANDIAPKLGIPPITLVLPLEIASCLGRSASPIAGGVIALAGFAKVAPMEIIKRTMPLLIIAMIANILTAWWLTTKDVPEYMKTAPQTNTELIKHA
ncbi:C4-dicarboxylate ABC transporter [Campylobacter sp. MIT 99-7217]|uniref:C4-dicarboxylate transporter DcuC n=1 Tax=Campylobacter sp. MIT 99-7217 TaxID=535091 RepID=UPI00115A7FB5|nr:C4-dicarboxylate transporter DcuC [Campylobacter sp. MIT 99-7217]TQR30604.1 C4-dicarboxylate ABC transporter [Campylobacter sp. MIT 99-7217]